MNILCDVCGEGEASFYCAADEASICAACDHRVHHANKFAGKHLRFSLHPAPKETPLCDICQERRALLFCQQDRAILCRECDIPIHKHTQKHTRFLLAGVTISAAPRAYSNPNDAVASNKAAPKCTSTTPPAKGTSSSSNLQFSTRSISEYLTETLPGWHVEDLLDSTICCKSGENAMVLPMPLWDSNLHSSNMGSWVPQLQMHQTQNQSSLDNNSNYYNNNNAAFGLANGCSQNSIKFKSTRKRSEEMEFFW